MKNFWTIFFIVLPIFTTGAELQLLDPKDEPQAVEQLHAPQYGHYSYKCDLALNPLQRRKYAHSFQQVHPEYRALYQNLTGLVRTASRSFFYGADLLVPKWTVGGQLLNILEARLKTEELLKNILEKPNINPIYRQALLATLSNISLDDSELDQLDNIIALTKNADINVYDAFEEDVADKVLELYHKSASPLKGFGGELLVALEEPNLRRTNFVIEDFLKQKVGDNFSANFCLNSSPIEHCENYMNKEVDLWMEEDGKIIFGEVKNSNAFAADYSNLSHHEQRRHLDKTRLTIEILDEIERQTGIRVVLRYYFLGRGINAFLAQEFEALGVEIAQ